MRNDRIQIEEALKRHYAGMRNDRDNASEAALAASMLAEDARSRARSPRRGGTPAFVAAQVRYIPAWTWAAQIALVVLMCVFAQVPGIPDVKKLCIGVLAAMSVLVGVPTIHSSKLHRVAELEYACPRNAASVLAARLLALGCSSALAVALMIAATAPHIDASSFDVALWACPPFFATGAFVLMTLRKAAPASTGALTLAWALACSFVLLVLANVAPGLYGQAAIATWGAAAGVALLWLVREAVMLLKAAALGLDAFSPHTATRNN